MIAILKRLGLAGAALAAVMPLLMAWAFGGSFTFHWFGSKADGTRGAVRQTVSDKGKLDVYRRMIADDAPIKAKIHEIATIQRDLTRERENLGKAGEDIAALAGMVAILRDDLVNNPDQAAFTYRTVKQAQPRVFERQAVEQDLAD